MLIELLTAFSFLLVFLKLGHSVDTVFALALVSIVIVVTFIDIDHHIILDRIIFGTMFLGVLNILILKASLLDSVYGFLVGGMFLFVISLFGPMGGGDIKWMASLGFLLGLWKTVMALMVAFVVGALISICLIVLKIKGRKDYIPFGPFLGLGVVASYFYFYEIAIWYLKMIGM